MGIKALTKLLMGHNKAVRLLAMWQQWLCWLCRLCCEVVAMVGKLAKTQEMLCSFVPLN